MWYRQSAVDKSLAFHATCLDWQMNGEAFTIMAAKTLKNLYCSQTVIFKLS